MWSESCAKTFTPRLDYLFEGGGGLVEAKQWYDRLSTEESPVYACFPVAGEVTWGKPGEQRSTFCLAAL